MKRKMNDITTIFLILLLIAGLSLLLYPTVSDHWNAFHSSQAISSYTESVANLTDEQYKIIWSAAVEYNQTLAERGTSFVLSDAQKAAYEKQLDVSGVGIMGYIEIPQVAVGHMEWSSLPVGGTSSHCVLSGHRGLPSAKLFTDLDKLQEGDIFMLRVLDEVLTYEVDQIRIVEPSQVSDLQLVEGKDLCTLVTCTPYGVNTQRLLVRGHRIKNIQQSNVTSDALQIEPLIVAPIVATPLLLLLLVLLFLSKRQDPSDGGNEDETV